MKNLRAVLCMLLALVMILGMAACGSKTTNEDARKPSDGTSGSAAPSSSSSSSGSSGSSSTPSSGSSSTPSSGSSEPAPVSSDPDRGKVIRIGVDNLGRFLAGIAPSENQSACDIMFDTSFKINPTTKQIESDYFKEWYWEDDNHFVCKMYDNIYFSTGNHATSEDVLYSYYSHIERGSNYLNDTYIDWDKTELRDDYTICFYCDVKNRGISRMPIYLLDKKWSESLPDGWADEAWYYPETSGPYKCVEYAYDDYMVLQLRDSYWKRDISEYHVQEYRFKAYKDESTMYMDLELGNIDLCGVASADYSRFLKTGNGGAPFNVILKSSGVCAYINFAWLDNPIWQNEDLRMAFAYGIDLEALGMLMYNDTYMAANSVVPNEAPYYEDVGHREYNPELAKEYLKKAGYGPGDLTLKMTLMDTAVYHAFGEGFAYYMDEMGVNLEMNFADISASIANWIVPGNNDLGMLFSISGSDTMAVTDSIQQAGQRGGVAWTFVDDEEFQRLYDIIRYQWEDEVAVEKASREIQHYIFDHAMILPICATTVILGYNTDVLTEEQVRGFLYNTTLYKLGHASLEAEAWS